LAPYAQDVVVTGHDRHEIGLLVFLTPAADALSRDELQAHIAHGLAKLRMEGGGSSASPARALLLSEPPSVENGEITDKGYVNQRAVLQRRAAQVETLYAGGPGVILPQTR
jgi:feruloyl-CoA synthase